MTCLPLGIPRQGPPARIFHTDTDITMIYRGGVDGAGGYAEFRMIPIDGKPHDPRRALQYTYMGYTVGRWEGDTLVLDSIGFSDETWLGRGGWFHSDQMRVIEKFTRTGNQMLYEVTVEDPVVLVEPWVMPARTLRLANNHTIIAERGSCTESELSRGQHPDAALAAAPERRLDAGTDHAAHFPSAVVPLCQPAPESQVAPPAELDQRPPDTARQPVADQQMPEPVRALVEVRHRQIRRHGAPVRRPPAPDRAVRKQPPVAPARSRSSSCFGRHVLGLGTRRAPCRRGASRGAAMRLSLSIWPNSGVPGYGVRMWNVAHSSRFSSIHSTVFSNTSRPS